MGVSVAPVYRRQSTSFQIPPDLSLEKAKSLRHWSRGKSTQSRDPRKLGGSQTSYSYPYSNCASTSTKAWVEFGTIRCILLRVASVRLTSHVARHMYHKYLY
jgi:hypothetical protein